MRTNQFNYTLTLFFLTSITTFQSFAQGNEQDVAKDPIWFMLYTGIVLIASPFVYFLYSLLRSKQAEQKLLNITAIAGAFLIYFALNPNSSVSFKHGDTEISAAVADEKLMYTERRSNEQISALQSQVGSLQSQLDDKTKQLNVAVQRLLTDSSKVDIGQEKRENELLEALRPQEQPVKRYLVRLTEIVAKELQSETKGDRVTLEVVKVNENNKVLCKTQELTFSQLNEIKAGNEVALFRVGDAKSGDCILSESERRESFLKAEIIYRRSPIWFGEDKWLNESPIGAEFTHTFEFDGWTTDKSYVVTAKINIAQ